MNSNFINIKNYIWDLDGTLFNSYPIMVNSIYKILCSNCQIPIDFSKCKAIVKKSVLTAYQHYQPNMSLEEFQFSWKNLEKFQLNKITLFPYVKKLLYYLSSNNCRHFIFTHRDHESTLLLLELHKMKSHFIEIITADNAFPRKPNPDALLYLSHKYDLSYHNTIMIGDRTLDIDAANNANIQSAYISQNTSYNIAKFNYNSIRSLYTDIVDYKK